MAITTQHDVYGNEVDISINREIKSKHTRKAGLGYPLIGKFIKVTGGDLQVNENQGSYFRPAKGISLIKNNLRQFLLCDKGERIMRPNYGISIKRYLFEPLDEITFFLIKNEISKSLYKYFTNINIINLAVYSTQQYVAKNQIIIKLTLQLADESLDIFDVEVNIG